MSNLRQEMLLNQTWTQSVLKELKEKNDKIMKLEMKLLKAAILIEEGGSASELGLEGPSLPYENPALSASDIAIRDQGCWETVSTRSDTQGSSCPPLGKASQGEEVSPHAVELEGATGHPGQANPNLEQIDIIAE